MAEISRLAAQLRPYWLRDTGAGTTTINQYITEETGGGGAIDLSWLVPKSFPMTPAAPITISGDFWAAGMTFGLSLDSSGGLEESGGNLRVKLNSPSYLNRTSSGMSLAAHPIISLHTVTGSALDLVGATSTNTLGMITPSTNPGVASAVLKSDTSGYLTLVRQYVTEGVYTPSGDLSLAPATGITTLVDLRASTRLRSPLLDATGNLAISPVGDLTLSPGGADVIVPVATSLRSDNFAAGFPLAGFRIGPTALAGQSGMQAGSGEFDELRARIFVADETRVDRGQEYITKSYGILSRPFTSPGVVDGTVHVYFENSPHIAGAIFTNNDWIMFRYLDMSGGGIVLTSVWGQVSAYNVSGLTGEQRWTFTFKNGSTSLDFVKGAMAVNFGASGQGYILSDAVTATAPFIQIGKWATNPYTPANRTVTTQIGKLDGVGFTGEYGIAASVAGFTSADSWLKAATGGVAMNNIDAEWYNSGVKTIWVNPSDGVRVKATTGFVNRNSYGFERRLTTDYMAGMYLLDNGGNTSAQFSVGFSGNAGFNGVDKLVDISAGSHLSDASDNSVMVTTTGAGGMALVNAFSGDTDAYGYGTVSMVLLRAKTIAMWNDAVDGGTLSVDLRGNLAVTGGSTLGGGAYAERTGAISMTSGWRRIGRFSTSNNRGLVKLTIFNTGGAGSPWVTEIDAFHSWTIGTSSVQVRDCVGSGISAVRITNDSTYAYVECNFTGSFDQVYFQLEATGWANGFTLYSSVVAGGGSVECSTSVVAGISLASSGASTSYFSSISASGSVAAGTTLASGTSITAGTTVAAGTGSWGTGYRFTGSDFGVVGNANYLVLENNGAPLLSMRTDNADSALRLGYGNTNNRNAYVDFFANGAAPTTFDARLIRSLGVNGTFDIINNGTGSIRYRQTNLGSHIWQINGADVMALDTSSRLGATSFHATGDNGGITGSVGMTGTTSSTISTGVGNVRMGGTTARTNTHWIKFFIGTTAVYVPAWTQLT